MSIYPFIHRLPRYLDKRSPSVSVREKCDVGAPKADCAAYSVRVALVLKQPHSARPTTEPQRVMFDESSQWQ